MIRPHLLKDIFRLLNQKQDQPFDLNSLAEAIGYSKYYLCRAFHAATGEPLITYLRRLALARSAEHLSRKEATILDVALKCGYQSQEAFHRAFCDMFHITPKAFQKGHHHPSLMIKQPWNESFMPSVKLNTYSKTLDSMTLYGIGGIFSYQDSDKIFDLWKTFHNKTPTTIESFGVTLSVDGEPRKFRYFAASPLYTSALPLEKITIPKQNYQVFEHVGPATTLLETFNYIWGIWFPSQNVKVCGIDFEKYPAGYSPYDCDSIAEIYIPLC